MSPDDTASDFEILGSIQQVETIVAGAGLRLRKVLRKLYGPGRRRKMKGVAQVRLRNGRVRRAEVRWYEAHGIGRRDQKIKRFLDKP